MKKNMHDDARNSAKVAPAPDDNFLGPPSEIYEFEVQNNRTSDLASRIAQIAPAPLDDEQNFPDAKRNEDGQAVSRWRSMTNMQAVVQFLKAPKNKKKVCDKN